MHIQINTDKNVSGHEARAQSISETLTRLLSRFDEQITRVEYI